MFASTLTKCLDQLFQTTMLALNDESLQLMQNCGKLCSVTIHAKKSHLNTLSTLNN